MITNLAFNPQLKILLPDTFALINSSGLVVHEKVVSVILHGSRGLARCARHDSDIDLSLIVDVSKTPRHKIGCLLEEILRFTLDCWHGSVELDIACVFDNRDCQLKCFYTTEWNEAFCKQGGKDCFGLYKIQKSFHGFVDNAGLQIQKMHPCLLIWHRQKTP